MHFTFGVRSRRLGPDNVLVGWVIKDDTTRHTNVHVNVIFTFSELHYLCLDAYFGASVFPRIISIMRVLGLSDHMHKCAAIALCIFGDTLFCNACTL